jgi:hypothetical protein
MKRLSITTAVAIGTFWVNIPVLPLLFAPLAALFYFAPPDTSQPPTVSILMAMLALFLLGFVIAWCWWSYMVPRWRVWAWERVEDLHGLRKRAVRAGLIWPEGHRFEKTEFRTRPLRDKLAALEAKEHRNA